jgi:hypothetical protein
MMCPPLLDMKTCGIDTDSAVSASTRRSDFLTLDTSQDACESIDVRGVGEGRFTLWWSWSHDHPSSHFNRNTNVVG